MKDIVVVLLIAGCGGVPQDTLDSGSDDASAPTDAHGPLPDAAPVDGMSAVGCPDDPALFCENFLSTERLDPEQTGSLILTSPPGIATSRALRTLPSTGTGAGGAYVPTASGQLAPGSYDYTDIRLDPGVVIGSPGNLVLRATGNFRIEEGARLDVDGTVSIAAAEAVVVDCGAIYATGDVTISAGEPGVSIGCTTGGVGSITTEDRVAPKTGRVLIETRGPVSVGSGGSIHTGDYDDSDVFNTSGEILVAGYGDVSIRGTGRVEAGAPGILGGYIDILTEGTARLEDGGSMAIGTSGSGGSGPGIAVTVGGDLVLAGASSIVAGDRTSSNFRANGSVTIDGGSALDAPGGVYATAMTLTNGSTSQVMHVELDGPLTLDASSEITPRAQLCQPGTDLIIKTTGDIALTGDSYLRAGASTSDGLCSAQEGGWLIIDTGGTVTATGTPGSGPWLRQGIGMPPGNLDIQQETPVDVYVGAAIWFWEETTSLALAEHMGETIQAIDEAWLDAVTGQVLISIDGSEEAFAPATDLVGQALSPGWKFRLRIPRRLFDSVRLDYFTVAFE